jgi:hypothetical protein
MVTGVDARCACGAPGRTCTLPYECPECASTRRIEEARNRDVQSAAQGIDFIQRLCHEASVKAGWWEGVDTEDPNILGTKIALIHSEVSEMLEGLRKGLPDDHLPHRSMEEVEAADILIRLFDYAGVRGFDLSGAVAEKMIYNRQRADHKLENRAAAGGKKF